MALRPRNAMDGAALSPTYLASQGSQGHATGGTPDTAELLRHNTLINTKRTNILIVPVFVS